MSKTKQRIDTARHAGYHDALKVPSEFFVHQDLSHYSTKEKNAYKRGWLSGWLRAVRNNRSCTLAILMFYAKADRLDVIRLMSGMSQRQLDEHLMSTFHYINGDGSFSETVLLELTEWNNRNPGTVG